MIITKNHKHSSNQYKQRLQSQYNNQWLSSHFFTSHLFNGITSTRTVKIMARLVTPLSVSKINAAKPKEKLYKLSDGGGLALWVYPTGKKSWRFEYRRADKKLDTITFGSYPELSLADVREMRNKNRSLIAKGIDPKLADKVEEVVTLESVYKLWSERWHETVSTGYAIKMFSTLDNNVMPTLGNHTAK